MGRRDEALHCPLFLHDKLIEELRGLARLARVLFTPGQRLPRWLSLDQVPQQGDTL